MVERNILGSIRKCETKFRGGDNLPVVLLCIVKMTNSSGTYDNKQNRQCWSLLPWLGVVLTRAFLLLVALKVSYIRSSCFPYGPSRPHQLNLCSFGRVIPSFPYWPHFRPSRNQENFSQQIEDSKSKRSYRNVIYRELIMASVQFLLSVHIAMKQHVFQRQTPGSDCGS